ncbi:MAG: substrate-binding domain-containing protein, partial [Candidatus Bathyarchaeia archaeon]
ILGIVGTGILIAYEHLQPPRRQALILATTTSTFDSGLLDHLIPIFEGKYDIKVKILSKGTGESIEIAKRGDADVILVHARQLEEAFVSEGYGVHRVGVMYNDFIIIGPKSDPAGIRGLTDASLAFKKIFEAGSRGDATFISRADNSGTHNKELSIWTKIDVKPSSKTFSWYLEAGAGMGAVLRMTDEKGAYALTDRGTWLASKNRLGNLAVMVEGDTILLNPYAVIPINPERYPQRNYKMALAFVKFLISEEGQELIGNFERGGETLFFPIARDYNKAHELGFPNQEREVRWYDSIDPFALILTISSRLRSGPAS